MGLILRFTLNRQGRDFAVGDIHGWYSRLQRRLDEIGFDPKRDRLFSVGDLIDRGPESERVLEWLAKPWFHAVQGNHEDVAVRYAKGNPVDPASYSRNGGDWFMALSVQRRQEIAAVIVDLPVAIEVETEEGIVGLVHADCPFRDWGRLRALLEKPPKASVMRSVRDQCIWSRRRITEMDSVGIEGIRAVIVGHTPLQQPVQLGNVYHIDTGGWLPDEGGHFTLLDLHQLKPV